MFKKFFNQWFVIVAMLLMSVLLFTGFVVKPAELTKNDSVTAAKTRAIIDSRGKEVILPEKINRVATISDALVEEVMKVLGEEDKVIGIGSTCLIRDFTYDFETISGEKFSYIGGMNPANFLIPELKEQPFFVKSGTEPNYETLASLNPDVVIIHQGCCTLTNLGNTDTPKAIEIIEKLGIPVVVVYGPNYGGEPTIETLSNSIKIIGDVFDKKEKATELADYLVESVQLVIDRTENIPETEKPEILMFGLNPTVRKNGNGVGSVLGLKTIESYLIEDVVHAKNAYKSPSLAFGQSGETTTISAEQVLALDPDVIILPTSNGYHPPRELYEAPYFQNLQTLSAVKNKRVAALPWSPCNCDKRLEYPIDVMVIAKTAYPELFADVDLREWLIDFYQNVYLVDQETAEELLSAQWMDWVE